MLHHTRDATPIRDDILHFSLTNTDMLWAVQTGRPCLASWRTVRDRPALLTRLVKDVNKESGLPRLHPSSLHTLFYSLWSTSFHLALIRHLHTKSTFPQSLVIRPAQQTMSRYRKQRRMWYRIYRKYITQLRVPDYAGKKPSIIYHKNGRFQFFSLSFPLLWQSSRVTANVASWCCNGTSFSGQELPCNSIHHLRTISECKYTFPGEI